MSLKPWVACVALAAAGVAETPPPARAAATCANGRAPQTTLFIEGNLYAVVRAQQHYLFGASGRTVLDFAEALRLIRALGYTNTKTTAQVTTLIRRAGVPGATFSDGGGASEFDLDCRGVYTVTALVRREGNAITGTRFWLQLGQQPRLKRAFCMPEQWVPAGALVSVTFRAPLATTAPVFTIDWDGNGKIDSVGPFQPGGARFPSSERC
jgi:hypothetical protein